MQKVLKSSGFFLSEIIVFIVILGFIAKFSFILHKSYQQHSLSLAARELVIFLQMVREKSISDGITQRVILQNNSFIVKNSDTKLVLPKHILIKADDFGYKNSFSEKQIQFYPDGHVSAGSLYLEANTKNIVKITISVHQVPIFSVYRKNNSQWSKI